MNRQGRRAFLARTFAALAVAALGGSSAFAGTDPFSADTLKSALRVTTQAQAAFIDDVVAKRKSGELPESVFRAAYQYAMKKDANRRPWYFKLALEQLSKRAGLRLSFPAF